MPTLAPLCKALAIPLTPFSLKIRWVTSSKASLGLANKGGLSQGFAASGLLVKDWPAIGLALLFNLIKSSTSSGLGELSSISIRSPSALICKPKLLTNSSSSMPFY